MRRPPGPVPAGLGPEEATSGPVPEPVNEPVPDAASVPSPGPTHEPFSEPVTDSATGLVVSEPTPPDIAERLASALTRLVDGLLSSYPERAADFIGQVDDLASGLARAVSGLLGDGDEAPSPVNDPFIPPAAPAPATPVPSGKSSPAGGSSFGGSGSSGGASEGLHKEFGVLVPFLVPLMQGGKLSWPSREPLKPNSALLPAAERPS